MIRYFNRNETNFNHNETILTPISCFITEEANGLFELEAEFDKNTEITEGNIIKAPSPRGEQLFRIYRIKKSLKRKIAYARHIFYDLSKNFLINVELNNVSGFTAIQTIMSNCEADHNFIAASDVLTLNSATYTRINPIEAIIGDENSILNLYGGNLIRNNFNINIKAAGTDRGYEIRMGKNLMGIDADIEESNVKTRIYPTIVLGDNDTVYALPEKYVDSPLINHYGEPIIYTVEVALTDDQKQLIADEQLGMADLYDIMRDYCYDLFENENIDKPVINYKVDFVELSKTEQYKDLAILEQLDLYDIVTVNVSHLDINVKVRVLKYKYDCLKDRYEKIELGDFSSVSSYTTDGIVSQINNRIKANETAVEYATNIITGNKGGYLITRRYPDGKPYELLIMDTEDINTASNVFRLNKSGLGFSQSGYNGPYGTAMTIDGHIVADFMDTGTLTTILLKSKNYIANTSGMKINLADGTMDSKTFKIDTNGNGIFSGSLQAASGTFTGSLNAASGTFTGQLIGATGTFSGSLSAASGTFKGKVTAGEIESSIITGSRLTSSGYGAGYLSKTLIDDGFITSHLIKVRPMNLNTNDFSSDSSGYLSLSSSGIAMFSNATTTSFYANLDGSIYGKNLTLADELNVGIINGGMPITYANMLTYLADKYHNHSGVYADSFHRQSSYTITPELTSSGNISLYGSPNAASTTWCNATFEPKSSSDFRLKKNITTLNLPDELFLSLKPKQFEFKCDEYNKGLVFGLLAQQVEKVFKQYGYDPYLYNLIELVEPKTAYTEEGLYVGKDKVHRINYNNLIPWNINITQRLYNEVSALKETVHIQQSVIDSQADKINEIEQRLSKLEVA